MDYQGRVGLADFWLGVGKKEGTLLKWRGFFFKKLVRPFMFLLLFFEGHITYVVTQCCVCLILAKLYYSTLKAKKPYFLTHLKANFDCITFLLCKKGTFYGYVCTNQLWYAGYKQCSAVWWECLSLTFSHPKAGKRILRWGSHPFSQRQKNGYEYGKGDQF